MHLIGPGHIGSLSQNHRREFEFLPQENVSEKTQEEERRRRHCIIQTESVRGRGGCGSFYMELSHWCLPTRSRRSGGNPPYAFILVTGTALDIQTDSASPLHLPSGATRRKSFFGRSVRLTTESGQWQSCGREIIYYNICVHAVYSCPNGTIRVRRDAKLGWGMSGTVCSLTFALNPLFSWGGGGLIHFNELNLSLQLTSFASRGRQWASL